MREATKTIVVIVALVAWMASAVAQESQQADVAATVRLKEEAEVGEGPVRLGQMAEIEADEQLGTRLAQVNLGLAPPSGSMRVITQGYIRLRLRRAGIEPSRLVFAGAERVMIQQPGPKITEGPKRVGAASGPDPPAAVLERGDRVVVVVRCGVVEVRAQGQSRGRGGVGDMIEVRILGTNKTAQACIVSSSEVEVRAN